MEVAKSDRKEWGGFRWSRLRGGGKRSCAAAFKCIKFGTTVRVEIYLRAVEVMADGGMSCGRGGCGGGCCGGDGGEKSSNSVQKSVGSLKREFQGKLRVGIAVSL